nr:GerMN domain-containing protein [uncultured Sellimonas sp.]
MSGKKMVVYLLVLIMTAGLLSGCGKGDQVRQGEFGLFYLSADKTELMRVACEKQDGSKTEQVQYVLDALKNPEEESEDYLTPFQNGVEVEEFEIDGKQVELSFNEEYRTLDTAEEVLLRAAVVKSLVQISGISYVSFYIGEEPLMKADKTLVGMMSDEDFVQNVGSSLHSYQSTSLTLYFANKDGDRLVKETVNNVRYNSNISMERLVIEQLLKGPSSSGAYATIPSNTKILSVSTKDQICYVNFDQELMNMKSNVKPEILIYSIVNSIVESGMAGQVQISINGESDINFGESVPLNQPLSRNLDLVEGADKD